MKSNRFYIAVVGAVALGFVSMAMVSCKVDEAFPSVEGMICEQLRTSHIREAAFDGPVFHSSDLIEVPSYTFSGYTLKGDALYTQSLTAAFTASSCCEVVRLFDRVSVRPVLKWTISDDSLMAAAIFKGRVFLDQRGGRIKNVNDIVWAWHSKLNGGLLRTGNTAVVTFSEGRAVVKGNIAEDSLAGPLEENTAYSFVVWAWNREATRVVRSSREIFFMTEGPIVGGRLSKSSDNLLFGRWERRESGSIGFDEIAVVEFSRTSCRYQTPSDSEMQQTVWHWPTVDDEETQSDIEIGENRFVLRDILINCTSFSAKLILPNGDQRMVEFARRD